MGQRIILSGSELQRFTGRESAPLERVTPHLYFFHSDDALTNKGLELHRGQFASLTEFVGCPIGVVASREGVTYIAL